MKLLTTSFRTLKRFRLYSVVNIVGLAVSLACVIVIARYVHQEATVNHFIPNLDRVYFTIVESQNRPPRLGGVSNPNNDKNFLNPLEDLSVKLSSSFVQFPNEQITVNSHQFNVNAMAVDSAFLVIVPYPVMRGSAKMLSPNEAVITQRLAKKLFGNANAIGQKITYSTGDVFTVIGVLGEPTTKSGFDFDLLFNRALREHWMRTDNSLALLHRGADSEKINQKYAEFRDYSQFGGEYIRYQLFPLKKFYFDKSIFTVESDSMFLRGNRNNVLTLSIVAGLILLIGVFSFINIYTVIILKRAREFGIKKIHGAKGRQIFGQIYTENFLQALLAVFGAWLIVEILTKVLLNRFSLSILPNTEFDMLFSLILLFLLPFITSLYPFFRYTYSSPITSLRSVDMAGVSLVSRAVFLALQYIITFGLVVVALFFIKQLNFMLSQDLGYNTKDMIVCRVLYPDRMRYAQGEAAYQQRRSRFEELTETIERKMNASPLFSTWIYGEPRYTVEPYLPLKIDGGEFQNVGMIYQSRKQMELLGYQILEGRGWDSTDVSTQYKFIINESAKKAFGISDIRASYLQPERRLWYNSRDGMSSNPAYEIVGVIKDFNTGHLSKATVPLVIIYQEEYMKNEHIIAKIVSGKREEAIQFLDALNSELYGDADFNYTFMEDDLAALYDEDKRISDVYTLFSLIAICISCLGLFALSLFDVQQRYREIALRKINGATSKDIIYLLLKKYIYLLLISFVLAVPIASLTIQKYMENFAHRTDISWWLFAIAAIVVSTISLLTLTWQIKRAIKINPTKVLKG